MNNGTTETVIHVPRWGMTIFSTVISALIIALVVGQLSQWETVNRTSSQINATIQRLEAFTRETDKRLGGKLETTLALEMFARRDDKIDSLSGRVYDNTKRIRQLWYKTDGARWHPPLAHPPTGLILVRYSSKVWNF